jgi:hypothetical protein
LSELIAVSLFVCLFQFRSLVKQQLNHCVESLPTELIHQHPGGKSEEFRSGGINRVESAFTSEPAFAVSSRPNLGHHSGNVASSSFRILPSGVASTNSFMHSSSPRQSGGAGEAQDQHLRERIIALERDVEDVHRRAETERAQLLDLFEQLQQR